MITWSSESSAKGKYLDVLIVGAGMSGLMAARTLQGRGLSARLVESGRGVGGRLATRQVGAGGLADLGAQFFTVRGELLESHVQEWLALELVYVWGTGWSDGSVKRTAGDGHARYATRGGMNELARHLAGGLDLLLSRRVLSIRQAEDGWTLEDSKGDIHKGAGLILTPPMPETLALLSRSEVNLHAEDLADFRRIRFGPCLCGVHEIDGEMDLPEPGAMQSFQSDVYWVADNEAKGISQTTIVTSHANAKFSRQNWDASEADIVRELESAVSPYLRAGAKIRQTQLKKWRYSVPLSTHPQECVLARDLPNLVFAGDAFGGRGRVEGAFMSGIEAGTRMADALT